MHALLREFIEIWIMLALNHKTITCVSFFWWTVIKWPLLQIKLQFACTQDACPAEHMETKGQLNSEWIYEVFISPKMQPKNYKDFCSTIQTRIVALFFGDFLVSAGSFFSYDPCLFGRADILAFFGLYFGKNDDLINSFWI